jgi:hypothetical protein
MPKLAGFPQLGTSDFRAKTLVERLARVDGHSALIAESGPSLSFRM